MPEKSKVEKILVQFYISKRVWEEFELLIWDPTRKRTKYGEKSKIIEMLLRNYTKERTGGTEQPELIRGKDFFDTLNTNPTLAPSSSDDGRGDSDGPGGNSTAGQRDSGSNNNEDSPKEDGRS